MWNFSENAKQTRKSQLSEIFKKFFRSILFSANSIFPFSTNSIFLNLKFLHFSGSSSQTTKSFQNGVSQKLKSLDDSDLLDGFSLVNLNGEDNDDDDYKDEDDENDDDNANDDFVSRQLQIWWLGRLGSLCQRKSAEDQKGNQHYDDDDDDDDDDDYDDDDDDGDDKAGDDDYDDMFLRWPKDLRGQVVRRRPSQTAPVKPRKQKSTKDVKSSKKNVKHSQQKCKKRTISKIWN